MQAEGIRAGDRYDVYDQFGKVADGWTAEADAEIVGHRVVVPIRYHNGARERLSWSIGEQVPLSWGVGG